MQPMTRPVWFLSFALLLGWMSLLTASSAEAALRRIDIMTTEQGTRLRLHSDQILPVQTLSAAYNKLVVKIANTGDQATILTSFEQAPNVDHTVVKHLPDHSIQLTILGHRLTTPSLIYRLDQEMAPALPAPKPQASSVKPKPAPVLSAKSSVAPLALPKTAPVKVATVSPTVASAAHPTASAKPVKPITPAFQLKSTSQEEAPTNTPIDILAAVSGLLMPIKVWLTEHQALVSSMAPYGVVVVLVLGLIGYLARRWQQIRQTEGTILSVAPSKMTKPTKQNKVAAAKAPRLQASAKEALRSGQAAKSRLAVTQPASALSNLNNRSAATLPTSASNPDIQAFLEAVASRLNEDRTASATPPAKRSPV